MSIITCQTNKGFDNHLVHWSGVFLHTLDLSRICVHKFISDCMTYIHTLYSELPSFQTGSYNMTLLELARFLQSPEVV